MNFREDLRQHFKINLTKEQIEAFDIYYQKLIAYNSHTNLTNITEETDVYYKHFYDSLTIIPFMNDFNGSLCDMGSGAGFPSLPIKIIYPSLKVTIVDTSLKRIKFLEGLVEELNLKDVNLVHSRIEDFAIKNLKTFDYVTARALGSVSLISELGIPLLKTNGYFLMMKGSRGFEEINEAKNVFETLKSTVVNRMALELPNNYGNRTIIKIKKDSHVNGYPRKYQEILKKPL